MGKNACLGYRPGGSAVYALWLIYACDTDDVICFFSPARHARHLGGKQGEKPARRKQGLVKIPTAAWTQRKPTDRLS